MWANPKAAETQKTLDTAASCKEPTAFNADPPSLRAKRSNPGAVGRRLDVNTYGGWPKVPRSANSFAIAARSAKAPGRALPNPQQLRCLQLTGSRRFVTAQNRQKLAYPHMPKGFSPADPILRKGRYRKDRALPKARHIVCGPADSPRNDYEFGAGDIILDIPKNRAMVDSIRS
jgi:hypothetical protein